MSCYFTIIVIGSQRLCGSSLSLSQSDFDRLEQSNSMEDIEKWSCEMAWQMSGIITYHPT